MLSLRTYAFTLDHTAAFPGSPGWKLTLHLWTTIPGAEEFVARAARRFLSASDPAIRQELIQAAEATLRQGVPTPPVNNAEAAQSWALGLLHRIDDGLGPLGYAVMRMEVRGTLEGRPDAAEINVLVTHPRWPAAEPPVDEPPEAAATVEVVLTTVPDVETGARIGRELVEARLAACVNVVPGVRSLYVWQGKLCDESEALLVIKTAADRREEMMGRLKTAHPYATPEILALRPHQGWPDYLRWVIDSTRPS